MFEYEAFIFYIFVQVIDEFSMTQKKKITMPINFDTIKFKKSTIYPNKMVILCVINFNM